MDRLNGPVRRCFRRLPALGAGLVVVAVCLAIAFSFAVWNAYAAPTEEEHQVTRLTYTQSSDFGFRARVTDNTLYGNVTLTQADTPILFLAIVDELNGVFSYSLSASGLLEQVSHEVRIEAVLASPDNWSKSLVLVPATEETGAFGFTFPIDTDSYLDLIDTIEDEIGVSGGAYDLTLRATVRTTAVSQYGAIDELLAHSMRGTLQRNRLTWSQDSPFSQARQGTLQDTEVVTLERGNGGIPWAVALGFVVLSGLYVAWNYAGSRPPPLAAIDREARRAKKKHEELIVDVGQLPDTKNEDITMILGSSGLVIPVTSLEELVKVSEALLKPVLHRADEDGHTYWVIDGLTKYQYVSESIPRFGDFEELNGGEDSD
jgi:hypothetical protein